MKSQRLLAALIAVVMAEAAVFGQLDSGRDSRRDSGRPSETSAWERFPLNPKVRVALDFRNASADAVLRMLSQASGVTIIKDPTLTGGITLQSPRQQSLADAFAMLNAVLNLKNFDLAKEGNFLVIRSRSQRSSSSRSPNLTPEQMQAMLGSRGERSDRGDQPQLRVYTIRYANASQVARVVNEAFIGSGSPQNLSQGDNNQGRSDSSRRSRQESLSGRRGSTSLSLSLVRASADDFSNSVIVNAPSREHEQIARLIEQIDKQTEQPQQSRVFNLQYAGAAELAPVVQNVLVSNAPLGRGGQGSQTVPIDQRFQQARRFGSAQAAFGTVVAEPRTNSLVVTATEDNLELAAKVIQQLDKEVAFENSTFVVTLENARADVISQLLNLSFGGRTGGGAAAIGGGQPGNLNRRREGNNDRRPRSGDRPRGDRPGSSRPGGSSGNGRAADATQMPLDLADPGAESGELATSVSVRQGVDVAQSGGGAPRPRQPDPDGSGLDDEGRVVNVRDLTGQVVAVPDINTNSVIIVTSPENRAIVEQILAQLDRIPEQVMIETLIVEASLDASSKLGVEWSFTKGSSSATSSFGLQANPGQPQGLRYTLTGSEYSVFLQALQSDSRFEVLSTPRIFTSNNATAEINISQSLPYVLDQRVDVNGNVLFNYAFLDVGIILTVTPRITSNGYVTMEVTQTANDFVRYTEFNAPVVNQREAQTTVSVRDGETVVLGGIIKNSVQTTVNKVPLLGDIPLLGNLFKSTGTAKNKTELLVFLTPRVVRDAVQARTLREQTEGQLEKKTREKITESFTRSGSKPDQNQPLPQPQSSIEGRGGAATPSPR